MSRPPFTRKTIMAPGGAAPSAPTSSAAPTSAPSTWSCPTLDLLFPEAMGVAALLDALKDIGFPSGQLVSLTHSDLCRLFRRHVMPKPRRTLAESADRDPESGGRWMWEMGLCAGDDEEEEEEAARRVSAFAGIKRTAGDDRGNSSPSAKRFRPDRSGDEGGGGDRLKPPPATAASNSPKTVVSLKRSAGGGDHFHKAEDKGQSPSSSPSAKRPRSQITFP